MNNHPLPAPAATTHYRRAALASSRITNLLIAFAIIGLVLALRLPALTRSEINMDDSNFLTMGRELLREATPYVDFWDHNPLGGVALFGVAGKLFGYSYVTLRWLTMAAVAAQCCLLYLIAVRLSGGSRAAGIIAAATYAAYSINNLGFASDRIFFHAPLAALALHLVVRQPANAEGLAAPPCRWKLLAIGALLAISMQIKYLLPVEYAAVAGVVLLDAWQRVRLGQWARRQALRYILWAAVLLAGPALLLVALNAAYFASRGLFATWFYANFTANSIYAATTPFSVGHVARKFLIQFHTNALAWAGLLVAGLYLALNREWRAGEKRAYFVAGLWFIFPLAAVTYARRMDGHHFLQLLPALSVLTGLVVASLLQLADRPALPENRVHARRVGLRNGLLTLLILAGALYPQAHPQLMATARSSVARSRTTPTSMWPRG